MKKVIALLMCVVMLFAFTACLSTADLNGNEDNDENKINNDTTEVSGELPRSGINDLYKFDEYSDHVVLTEYIGTLPSVYIPNTINGKPVTEFGTIFKGSLTVRSIYVGRNCTEIAAGAFENCYNLQRVEITEGVASIAKNAFFGCHSLRLIYIPACVKTIADDAFPYITDLIIYGDKGTAAETFADKYASIYFYELNVEQESTTEADTESTTQDVS